MKKLKIGIDVDGVLYPFTEQFKKFSEKEYNKKLPEIEAWDFHNDWGITRREFIELYALFINSNCLEKGKPEINSKEIIDKLSKDGHEIYIVTHRVFHEFNSKTKAKALISTINWLSKNDIYYDHIIFIKDKFLINLDVLLDDGIHNLESFQKKAICFSRPWNYLWSNTKKINNFNEFYQKINEINI